LAHPPSPSDGFSTLFSVRDSWCYFADAQAFQRGRASSKRAKRPYIQALAKRIVPGFTAFWIRRARSTWPRNGDAFLFDADRKRIVSVLEFQNTSKTSPEKHSNNSIAAFACSTESRWSPFFPGWRGNQQASFVAPERQERTKIQTSSSEKSQGSEQDEEQKEKEG
jgi:hypothetical protein